jgi:hypothetical protein
LRKASPLDELLNFGDELTMTFKLRCHVITEKYGKEIGAMFDA